MKKSAGFVALAAAGMLLGGVALSPAQAQDIMVGPWCFETHENLTPDCSQPNLKQCRLTSLNGLSGRCYRNPNYPPARKNKRGH